MTSKSTSPTGKDRDLSQSAETTADAGTVHHEKVPEGAENIEHTLRRLNAEKAKRRQQNPGLYL
ncbi:hypothetical protein [Tropicimonas marinistellae]|uniref:hypothetical protein n=1 Tax=Tropicimonas marinistellae TaxID=1739787 RepID=UPI000836AEAA|nr:hypothetical protein [Tropicimonas marinistellae]